ncbi:MAG TPA: 2-oxoacid:acceptor oxidoreductase subunit alpha [Limnochordia bacterium]|nr:2-oxoacid:acceptor oxidoreductase subunit alpha [Limnochordia bacterium]HQD70569.1 2-oxoacid:acceptor oxidoreductase subunit alpha [Limnochordia bacterium]
MNSFNILVGGEAGQGLVSISHMLIKAVAKQGWYLFAQQDYMSRIRGGHNFLRLRISETPVHCCERGVDLLVALDQQSLVEHQRELNRGAVVIGEAQLAAGTGQGDFISIDFTEIAVGQGQPKIMANAVAAGAVWAFLADDLTAIEDVIRETFAEKGEAIVKGNIKCAHAGFELIRGSGKELARLPKPQARGERMVLKGNDALPSGALAAGVKFMSAYPMTPSTGVTEFIAAYAKQCSVVMEQAEDEIAGVNMAIGAAYAGVRAMTATSGGGFALMTEALGLAGSAEIPIVVINAQRPGPSTGLPTRTEQGDLLFAVHGGSGDYPKAVLSPGDVEEAFYLMGAAFNLADKYHTPVIVLSDQHLADSYQTIEPLDPGKVVIDRGDLLFDAGPAYQRYQYTESGVSPRLVPGFGAGGLVVSAGDEHGQDGHLIEDAETRNEMMRKRMRKMDGIKAEALDPVAHGSSNPEYVLIGFGSTKGAVREAAGLLSQQGHPALAVHLPQVYPLPDKLREIWQLPGQKWIVENNYSGQLQKLIAMEFALVPDGSVRKYDGRPFFPQEIVEQVLKGGAGR